MRNWIVGLATVVVLIVASTGRADLVGYWKLDGNALDSSSSGIDGALHGDIEFSNDVPTLLGGGMSVELNQTDMPDFGYVDLGNPDILNFSTNDWTVAAWTKTPDRPTDPRTVHNVFSNGGDENGGVRYILAFGHYYEGSASLITDDNAVKALLVADEREFITYDAKWHHLAGLREGSELRIYVDGQLAGVYPNLPDGYDLSGTSQQNAYIGIGASLPTQALYKNFNGWIDDVAVFNEALSESQIRQIMSGNFTESGIGPPNASFSDSADLDVLDIDFGTPLAGSPEPSIAFSITNLSQSEPGVDPDADLTLDSFTVSGDTHVLTTDLHSFVGLSPGESRDFAASMKTDTSGSFSTNAVLSFADGRGLEQTLTLDLSGVVPYPLEAGDVNQDYAFDQLDLVEVFLANKYLTGQPVTWGEGDWDGAPGGAPGNPPLGDGVFDQKDIVAALTSGHYLTGPYAAISKGGVEGDDQTSIIYDARTGEVAGDVAAGEELTNINIDSASCIFTGEPAQNLGGAFDNDTDCNIFWAVFNGFHSYFGNVAVAGLSEEFVANDLTVVGSLAGGGDLGPVDLIYIPEPSSLLLALLGIVGVLHWRRLRR